jgi:hypothetical protein
LNWKKFELKIFLGWECNGTPSVCSQKNDGAIPWIVVALLGGSLFTLVGVGVAAFFMRKKLFKKFEKERRKSFAVDLEAPHLSGNGAMYAFVPENGSIGSRVPSSSRSFDRNSVESFSNRNSM